MYHLRVPGVSLLDQEDTSFLVVDLVLIFLFVLLYVLLAWVVIKRCLLANKGKEAEGGEGGEIGAEVL